VIIVVQRSVYTTMVSSNSSARFCLALGSVVMVNFGSPPPPPWQGFDSGLAHGSRKCAYIEGFKR